uniref:ABC transporter permease n=1 Tax=Caenorhabditis tropicalis TaxID=1561998 RepID=A0A1I7UHK2_9PELO
MLRKLLALLKKDAILATRSKVWTMLELLFPVFILFCVNGMMGMMADTLKPKGEDGKKMDGLFKFSAASTAIFLSPQICEQKKVATEIYMRNSHDELIKQYMEVPDKGMIFNEITKKKFTNKDQIEEMDECEKVRLIVHKEGKNIKLLVPIAGPDIPKEEIKSAMSRKGDAYLFSGAIIQAILDESRSSKNKVEAGWSEKIDVNKIDAREVEISEVAVAYFDVILGLSMVVSIVNIVRTVVTEKSTVKPYLSAIGLPGWLFYTEHFISSFLKSTITCIGSMKFFMGLKYVSMPLMMVAVICYIIGAIAFAILFSAFFTNAKRGIEASLVFWIVAVFYPIVKGSVDDPSPLVSQY